MLQCGLHTECLVTVLCYRLLGYSVLFQSDTLQCGLHTECWVTVRETGSAL